MFNRAQKGAVKSPVQKSSSHVLRGWNFFLTLFFYSLFLLLNVRLAAHVQCIYMESLCRATVILFISVRFHKGINLFVWIKKLADGIVVV